MALKPTHIPRTTKFHRKLRRALKEGGLSSDATLVIESFETHPDELTYPQMWMNESENRIYYTFINNEGGLEMSSLLDSNALGTAVSLYVAQVDKRINDIIDILEEAFTIEE